MSAFCAVNKSAQTSVGALSGQRPLPVGAVLDSQTLLPRGGGSSSSSNNTNTTAITVPAFLDRADSGNAKDVIMDQDDDNGHVSENESVASDNRPAKKKKGQRFFCTEYPPCQLSFTRSEHLARHIRKHTGERPFQCHCNRRFSRLDNLRQHAQTVHVNEDIPGDSLAATGTRFQRQIRTDRVRPANSRPRASTTGNSTSAPNGSNRGHARNLSASSIASTCSNASDRDDLRRRPAPLAMAGDGAARAMLRLDTYNSGPAAVAAAAQCAALGSRSPCGFGTPSSASFSPTTGSPGARFTPATHSPAPPGQRPVTWAGNDMGRRLSVPLGSGNPFHGPPGFDYPPPHISPLSSCALPILSQSGSIHSSPTGSSLSTESVGSDVERRRQTWHPGTYSGTYHVFVPRPATSGLSHSQTVNAASSPQSYSSHLAADQPASTKVTRLPGIESFDHVPPPPPPPPQQPSSPMHVEHQHRPAALGPPTSSLREQRGHGRRPHHSSLDLSLQRGIHKLDIANSTPPGDPRLNHGFHLPVQQLTTPQSDMRTPWNASLPHHAVQHPPSAHQHASRNQRTSPEDSSSSEGVPTPSNSSLAEYCPVIVPNNGGIIEERPSVPPVEDASKLHLPTERHSTRLGYQMPPQTLYPHRQQTAATFDHNQQSENGATDMMRLDVLVAVAAGERPINRA